MTVSGALKLAGDTPVRALVVDDEPLARADVVRLLAGRPGVSVVGTCASGLEAVEAVGRLKPDLMLLDIRMPGLDGFGVVSRLEPAHMPYVVFVTAFDEYAIEAFEVRALDYLLKPVQANRLDEALARARNELRTRAALERATALHSVAREHERANGPTVSSRWWREVIVRTGLRDVVVRVGDIDWIEADAYYARLHVGPRSYLLRERMHVLEAHLDPMLFTRVHRSAIVNLDRVNHIAHTGDGEHVIVLTSGARVKSSHSRWLDFRALMRKRGRPDGA